MSDAEPPVLYTVTDAEPYRNDLLVRFAEIGDRTGAEALRGTSLTIDAADRRELGDGEFWVEDLVGCDVVGQDGASIGVIESVEFGAAQDRLAVRTEAGLFEVPFVDAIVPDVDLESRTVFVTPPEGLLPP